MLQSHSFRKSLWPWLLAGILILAGSSFSQSPDGKDAAKPKTGPGQESQAADAKQKIEITVTAPRVEIPIRQNPAATTVVETPILRAIPRTIAIDEVLKLVPGVKVDNQADGERVHLSIRGQGILTERGTRGIKTLLDGIPLNDPSGFVPDFFDIDWATVHRVEILRGPAAAFYGTGSSGGILNILTRDGGSGPIAANAYLTAGSFGFTKGLAEAGGTGFSAVSASLAAHNLNLERLLGPQSAAEALPWKVVDPHCVD